MREEYMLATSGEKSFAFSKNALKRVLYKPVINKISREERVLGVLFDGERLIPLLPFDNKEGTEDAMYLILEEAGEIAAVAVSRVTNIAEIPKDMEFLIEKNPLKSFLALIEETKEAQ